MERCLSPRVRQLLVDYGDMLEIDDLQFVLQEEMEASVQHDLAILRECFAELGELPSFNAET